ncbi:MAG: nuclear transport factor 2 family protein [Gammaproteobacteria bacterium]
MNVSFRALRSPTAMLLLLFATLASPVSFADSRSDPRAQFANARQEILDLISAYSYTYDAKDVPRWLELFTHDARWAWYAGPQRTLTVSLPGRQAMNDFFAPRLAALAQQGVQSRHFQTNTVFTSFNGREASAKTYVLVTWQYAGELVPRPVHTGYYEDKFVRTPRGWKFKERIIYVDHV